MAYQKHIKGDGTKEDMARNDVLNGLFFGLGATLQELMGTESGYSVMKAIGNGLLEYLKQKGVVFDDSDDPARIAEVLWDYCVKEGLAEEVSIECDDGEMRFGVSHMLGSDGLRKMSDKYGAKKTILPSPIIAMMLVMLGNKGYDAEITKLEYGEKEDTWYIGIKTNKILW